MKPQFYWFAWLLVCVCTAGASAQSGSLPARGLGLDLELDGGVGLGLQDQLDNNFLGRLRLGALYFDEPMVYALGITGEIGGLADHGVGVELEVSHFDGPWGGFGGARVDGDGWMTHVTLGYLFFGLEWQHRMEAAAASTDALVLVFRLPVGLWWFMMREHRPMHGPLPSMPDPSPPPSDSRAPLREEPVAPHAVLRLRVEPLADDESVWLDDQPLSIDALGYPYPIVPGPHVIVVKRADAVVVRVEVSAEVGGDVSLRLDPTQAPAAGALQPDEGSGVDVRTGTGEPAR